MSKHRNAIERARTLGRQAYHRNAMCIPAHDPACMELLKGRKVGDKANAAILEAWITGWTVENLAAPLPESEDV